MKKWMLNDRGISLVELLAVLAIGSIILSLVIGIMVNGQKTYSQQTHSAEQLTELRYAIKVITKEVRSAEKLTIVEDRLVVQSSGRIVFELRNGQLWQDGSVLAERISELKFEVEDRILAISMETDGTIGKKQEVNVQIYLREGVEIEKEN
ncbi:prepilin-type N-terminal cleavage/methylation domain-containing protein [Planococcus sp. A6]|uniref:PilW family protein n=1 Tax=Planococcus sp. A6 TaxID=2992760 RepID=UPI00237A1CA6|nr:prepilin-type N-terminal cleavage/methylation domain-containing protein [Planococcus sp. A6]MDE0583196.1 prepilin-type N-terminal cleavage/methylation domain-containing protein [Planococcus sp. A6]